ncbi:MAG: aminoglycoside phosphotransferase family protein [Alphaproteobacteria bacterium]|nr:aminoglycoside phosphotransferase family protein [Alphaproteobacteria bacterium]
MPFWITKDTPDKERIIREVLLFWNPSLELTEITFLPAGSNSAVFRGNSFIFRFPLTQSSFHAMKRDSLISELLHTHGSLEVRSKTAPVFIVDSEEKRFPYFIKFSYHKYINGKIMDNRRGKTDFSVCYFHLSRKQQERLAEKIAQFLADLHSIPQNVFQTVLPALTDQNWDFTKRIDEKLSRRLLLEATSGQLDLKEFKTECAQDFVFCHNDLSGSNLLIDLKKKDILQGIIDFGAAGIFPKTNEFVPFYKVGRHFARQIVKAYNTVSQMPVRIREIDYKFLCFIGFLLEQQKKPSDFITALIKNFIEDYFETQRT